MSGQILLTGGAILGVVLAVSAALAAAFGVRPVVIRSGSMSPTMDTGSVAVVHRTPAAQLRVGDVVTVPLNDTRVTHRIVTITQHGDVATIRLKGDANDQPDNELHRVRSAYRLWFAVPRIGYLIAWLAAPPGIYLLAAFVALMLLLAFRDSGGRTPRERGRRRARDDRPGDGGSESTGTASRGAYLARRTSVVLTLLMIGGAGAVGSAQPNWAAWGDTGTIKGIALGAFIVPKPAFTSPGCLVSGNSLTGFTATITWNTGTIVQATTTAMNYTAVVREGSAALTVTGTGSTRQTTVTSGLLGSLFGTTVHVDIKASLPGTPAWTSVTSTQALSVALLGTNMTCGAQT